MTRFLAQIVLIIVGSTELLILAKATVILVLGLVGLRLSRRAAASVRSLVLASTFGILLVLPIAALVMPPVALQVGAAAVTTQTTGLSAGIGSVRGGPGAGHQRPRAVLLSPSWLRRVRPAVSASHHRRSQDDEILMELFL